MTDKPDRDEDSNKCEDIVRADSHKDYIEGIYNGEGDPGGYDIKNITKVDIIERISNKESTRMSLIQYVIKNSRIYEI